MKNIFFAISLMSMLNGFSQNHYLIIGTYDSPKSEGIYVYNFDNINGSAKEVSHVKTSNPSYLTISPNKKYLYAVNENAAISGKGGSVTSFFFDKKIGTLTKINTQSSEGNDPCYITTDKTGKWIVTGNYSSGNFAVLPVNKKGELQKAIQIVQQQGKSIDTARQNSPHVHSTFFTKDNKVLYVTDLGTDKIMVYNFDEQTGKINPSLQKFISTNAGSGPRHIDISADGRFMYVMQELAGKIGLYSVKNNVLKEIQTVSGLPLNFKGLAGSADIHISPDGNFLYASNRGESNTIAIFKINKKFGYLSLITHQPSLGLAPRNFNFDPSGKYLLVANQNSNEVVIFKRNITTGLLIDTGNRISIGKPVCIKWL
jgi:6-phosphogluconolactonase